MKTSNQYHFIIQKAIDYVEAHILEELDCKQVAQHVFLSSYHFQRVFSIVCGVSLGEYIRRRRLTLAADALLQGNVRILDVAMTYGYDTAESFSRAFKRFHGCLPSEIRSRNALQCFSKINIEKTILSGGIKMQYTIQEMPEKVLVGFKKRFFGTPYGKERLEQERDFAMTTRAKQWLLLGASCDQTTDYGVITNIDDVGYDFYFAYDLDAPTREELFNPTITGVSFIKDLGFEVITIPRQTYVVFQTPKCKRPVADYALLRENIVKEWLPNTAYVFANAPELVKMYWRPSVPREEWVKERYIQICLPIEKVSKRHE